MTLEEYKDQYNYAPLMQYEFAQGAFEITDANDLKFAAQLYLHAKENFEQQLNSYGIEEG